MVKEYLFVSFLPAYFILMLNPRDPLILLSPFIAGFD